LAKAKNLAAANCFCSWCKGWSSSTGRSKGWS
jgi:hypothetical protein